MAQLTYYNLRIAEDGPPIVVCAKDESGHPRLVSDDKLLQSKSESVLDSTPLRNIGIFNLDSMEGQPVRESALQVNVYGYLRGMTRDKISERARMEPIYRRLEEEVEELIEKTSKGVDYHIFKGGLPLVIFERAAEGKLLYKQPTLLSVGKSFKHDPNERFTFHYFGDLLIMKYEDSRRLPGPIAADISTRLGCFNVLLHRLRYHKDKKRDEEY